MDPYDQIFKDPWGPNYHAIWKWRQKQLLDMRADYVKLKGAKAYYKKNPAAFIAHWVDTYDPRKAGTGLAQMPFMPFPRQIDMIEFIYACLSGQAGGLIEKARDMGATWIAAAVSVHLWLFWPGSSIGWGSRKESLVDKLGDPDSIFEKVRRIIRYMPKEFLPKEFNEKEHMTYMRIVNPENDATITGESGNNIGRGGRKLIYFKDESAHYENPEVIEAALADNTNVQIDISSVNGVGNVFHRRRESGVEWQPGSAILKDRVNVFVMDWSHNPMKDQQWYNDRKAKAKREGMMHVFAQEVDRDYTAALENILIPQEHVKAAVDAHLKLGWSGIGRYYGALDVADEGGDRHAYAARKGAMLFYAEGWPRGDVGEATTRTIELSANLEGINIQYDSIGVGAGVKSEVNRLDRINKLPPGIFFTKWAASSAVLWPNRRIIPSDPQSMTNKEYYYNLKAQAWWNLRIRFEKTWRALNEGIEYPEEELIFISSTIPQLETIKKELSQPTFGKSPAAQKLIVDKTPEGTVSPNIADAIMMAFWPNVTGYTLDGLT